MNRNLFGLLASTCVLTACVATAVSAQQGATPVAPVRDSGEGVQAGQMAVVHGVVLADTGRPLRTVRVNLIHSDNRAGRTAMTDDAGVFEFPPVKTGRYLLSASKPGYVPIAFGEMSPGSGRGARAIYLSPGEKFAVRLKMPVGGVLTGRVVDERGDAAVRVVVRAMRFESRSGSRLLQLGGTDTTDDRGIYRLYGLDPGEYVVAAAPSNDLVAQRVARRAALKTASANGAEANGAEIDEIESGYAPVYYPGGTAVKAARVVRLDAAQERDGLDFQLEVVPLTRVEGMVSGAVPGARTHVSLVDSRETVQGLPPITSQASPDGFFRLLNVPAGHYTLIAHSVSGLDRMGNPIEVDSAGLGVEPPREPVRKWAAVDIMVGETPVRNLGVALREGMTLAGRLNYVATKPTVMPTDLLRARVRLVPVAGTSGLNLAEQVSASAQRDGTFRITGIAPGIYRLVAVAEGGWALQSSMVGGRDTLDFPIEIKPGQDVADAAITLTDRRTGLSGAATDDRGRPAAGAAVVLFAADRQFWAPGSRRLLVASVATDGAYAFREVPAGEYRIAVAFNFDSEKELDPAALEELERIASSLSIADGEQKVQSLRSAAAPGAKRGEDRR